VDGMNGFDEIVVYRDDLWWSGPESLFQGIKPLRL
jgi:hypothetical protein